MKIVRSEIEGIAFAPSSEEGHYYRITGFGSAFPECSCKGFVTRGRCKHLVTALEAVAPSREDDMEEDTNVNAARVPVPVSGDPRTALATRADLAQVTAGKMNGSYSELLPVAQAMADSGLLPMIATGNGNDMKPMPAAMGALVMMKALELGVPPMSAFETLYVIGNRVKLQGQMVAALVQRSGLGRIDIVETDEKHAVAVGVRKGHPPLRVTFTIADAAKAELMKRPGWIKYPADMLRWKVVARVGRLLFADLLGGMDVADSDGGTIDSSAAQFEGMATGTGGTVEVLGAEPDHIADPGNMVDDAPTDAWQAADEPVAEGEYTDLPIVALAAAPVDDITAVLVEEMEVTGVTWGDIAKYCRQGMPSDFERKVEIVTAYCNDKRTNVQDLLHAIELAKTATREPAQEAHV